MIAHPGQDPLPWIAVALVLYLVALAVTIAVNVPLYAVKAAGNPDRIADLAVGLGEVVQRVIGGRRPRALWGRWWLYQCSQGAVEPLGLAVGLGPVAARALEGDPQVSGPSANAIESVEALALSVSTRWIRTPCSAKNGIRHQPRPQTRVLGYWSTTVSRKPAYVAG
jgi:hypothetical protein